MKKKILLILWMLLSLILPACGTASYEEIEAEAYRTGNSARLDRYERRAEKANIHFEFKTQCRRAKFIWYCANGQAVKARSKMPTTDEVVRDYRRERSANCTCVTPNDVRQITNQF